MRRSRGHVCIKGKCEYFLKRDTLYASLTTNEVDWNGYRKPASRVCYPNETASVLNLLGITDRGTW